MGWFSSDEVVSIDNSTHITVQTVALAVLAFIALTYGVLKIYNAHNRHQSEQAANNAVRLQAIATSGWSRKTHKQEKTVQWKRKTLVNAELFFYKVHKNVERCYYNNTETFEHFNSYKRSNYRWNQNKQCENINRNTRKWTSVGYHKEKLKFILSEGENRNNRDRSIAKVHQYEENTNPRPGGQISSKQRGIPNLIYEKRNNDSS